MNVFKSLGNDKDLLATIMQELMGFDIRLLFFMKLPRWSKLSLFLLFWPTEELLFLAEEVFALALFSVLNVDLCDFELII